MRDFAVSRVDSLWGAKQWRDQTPVRAAGYALLVCVAFYFGTKLGFALTFQPHPVSTLWPPNAILLAAFLLAPTRLWWVLLLAAFPSHLAVQLQDGVPVLMVLCWFISNASEALIGAFCIRRFIDGALRFDNFRCVSVFIEFAVLLAPLVTSFLDAGFVRLIGHGEDTYWLVWRMRLLANMLGALTLIPVIVMVGTSGLAHLLRATARRYVEAGLFAAGLVTSGIIAFQGRGVHVSNAPVLVYAPMPFFLWAAVRFGPAGVSASLLVTALLAIWGTVHGRGPFATLSPTENVFSLQVFLIAMTVPLMFLAALIEERRRTAVSLGESEQRYRAFFELTAVGAGEASPEDGRLLRVNEAHCRITGYTREELLGMSFIELTHPEDREKDLEKFQRLVSGEVAEYSNEKRYLRKDGGLVWVEVHISLLRDGEGRPLHTVAIVQDITERKRAESRLSTQYAISRILSGSTSVADAAPRLVQSICKGLDWELGEIWRVDREANLLTCLEIWHQPSSKLGGFVPASRQFTFPPGIGLPGRVWKSGKPAWVPDIIRDSNFPRASLAAKAGLRSAFGFPILFGGETLGVMVFISREARESDEDLLQIMASIGSQIGQFIGRKRAEESLWRSERNLRDFFQSATVGLHWAGPDGVILRANQAELDMLGYAHEEYVGHHIAEFHADPEVIDDILHRLAAGATLSDYETRLRRKDGTIRHVLISANGLWEEGRFVHSRCFTRDITDRKRLEEELRQREQEFATLVENSPDVIARLDRELRFLYVSPAAEAVFGTSAKQFIGRTAREVGLPAHDWEGFEASCRLAFASRITVVREFSQNGRHLQTRFIPELGDGGSVDSLMCLSQDVTERQRAQEELQRLSVRLLDLQDEERRRIARELHDGTAQNLFAITINLARLQEPGLWLTSEGKDALAECRALCEQSVEEIRTLSYLLHPPLLDQAGLVSALQWYVDGFAKRSGIDVGLVVTEEVGRLPREVETDLFRVVQESLANVHRHSGSGTVTVRLEKQGAELILQIKDQGCGMPEGLTAPPESAGSLGVGILGMRQRLHQHGGRLEIDSGGQGTTVRAIVPLFVERRLRPRARHAGD